MLAVCLGLAWLFAGPFALWVLVRGRALARVGAVLVLALLEAGTVVGTSVGTAVGTAPTVETDAVPPAAPPARGCARRDPAPEAARVSGR
ncbi:hypothetical protein, partial [Nonomuraea lactucae]|uniref:hypothetical protein n=1 Tax=Nonomuraea lactucae TaxID=2249762 RepID=UPI003B838633